KQRADAVAKDIEEYIETVKKEDNIGRYERGRLVIPTAILLVPGVGAATKVTRIKRSLSLLRKSPKKVLARFADEIFSINPRVRVAMTEMNAVGKFRQLQGRDGKIYRAGDFWKQENPTFKVYSSGDGKYVIKHDPETGRVIFADVEERRFLMYGLDENKFITGDYEDALFKLKTLHGLPGGANAVVIKGTQLALSRNKANVIFGRYDTRSIAGELGTKDIIEELSVLKNYSFADDAFELRPGGIY